MSLKNMKALARLCKDEAYQPEIEVMADDALKEIAALEKAAHMVTVVGQSEAAADRYEEWKAACELLRSIAKEAK